MTSLPPSAYRFSPHGHDNGALEKSAGALRDEVFGREVFVQGVIEVSNFCRQNCNYCGMRRDNRDLKRFRVELESLRELVRHGLPDVITDLNMPNMDGISLVRELRQLQSYKFVPMLMLTTESGQDKKSLGKAAGATGWLVKPFNPEKLLATIEKVL